MALATSPSAQVVPAPCDPVVMTQAVAELTALGIDRATVTSLAARYSPRRICDVAAAARDRVSRNPAGWTIRALEGGWAIEEDPAHTPAPAPTTTVAVEASNEAAEERWLAWDRAVSAALTDEELAPAVAASCASLPPAGRVVPAARARLIRWAMEAFDAVGVGDLRHALVVALSGNVAARCGDGSARDAHQAWPPPTAHPGRPLRERLALVLEDGRTVTVPRHARSSGTGWGSR